MKLKSVWTSIVYLFDVLTFQPTQVDDQGLLQQPIEPKPLHPHVRPTPGFEVIGLDTVQEHTDGKAYVPTANGHGDGKPYAPSGDGPRFTLPHHWDEPEEVFQCEYDSMEDYEACFGPGSRDCWLKHKNDGEAHEGDPVIGINTNYEDINKIPKGRIRDYTLVVDEHALKADSVVFEHAKLFNGQYPGPWLQACWGDTIRVTVKNKLRWNGTSVHWHGFRQLKKSHMDGVNGITECPIAPQEEFTYEFRAMQYGSAWYHSHYGLQYGDGTLGPITIYGPSTADYSEDLFYRPILMTDWNHRSVFEDWPMMLESGSAPEMTNILLNGKGKFGPGSKVADKYQLHFTTGADHHMILINTAVDTGFTFHIDHHDFSVIEMDFVPIQPYRTTSIKIGIGQRYHIVVHGLTNPYDIERNGNFWMRTIPMRKCSKFAFGPDEETGIIRYDNAMPRSQAPLSEPQVFIDISCADEKMENLIPWKGWQVENPYNIDDNERNPEHLPSSKKWIFHVGLDNNHGSPYVPDKPTMRWSMHDRPFRIDFSEPTLLNLDKPNYFADKPYLNLVTYPEDPQRSKWVWMVITAPGIPNTDAARLFVPAAHPMHLHGHDFAVLYQTDEAWADYVDMRGRPQTGLKHRFIGNMNCENELINCDNPTRRDVILLPAGGFVILAFKADNPGAWIFHCHIAYHASSGLAIQILENPDHIMEHISAEDQAAMRDRCAKWRAWRNDPLHLWDHQHPGHFQDDSGV